MEEKFSPFKIPLRLLDELTWLNYVTPHFMEGIYHQWCRNIGKDYYETLEDNIAKAKSKHKTGKINLIGHSMGGLEAIAYTLNNPDKVDNCVTVAAPFGGTNLSVAGISMMVFGLYIPTVLQILPSSEYMTRLKTKIKINMHKLEDKDVKVTNIWSPLDQFISREKTTLESILGRKSPAVEEHKLYLGHGSVFFCDYTTEILHKIIRESEYPTILLHGLMMNKRFFDLFYERLNENLHDKVYRFSYDYAKPLRV